MSLTLGEAVQAWTRLRQGMLDCQVGILVGEGGTECYAVDIESLPPEARRVFACRCQSCEIALKRQLYETKVKYFDSIRAK